MKVSVISRYNGVWQGPQGVGVGSAMEKAGHLHCQAALDSSPPVLLVSTRGYSTFDILN